MNLINNSYRKGVRLRRASRIIGYGGFLLAALVAAAWYIIEMVIGKKPYDSFTRIAIGSEKFSLPILLFAAAIFALVCIGIAIILRIVAHHYLVKGGNAILSTCTDKISETANGAKDLVKKRAPGVFAFCKEHAVVVISSAAACVALGTLIVVKKKKAKAQAKKK